jgi:hypothetical protein
MFSANSGVCESNAVLIRASNRGSLTVQQPIPVALPERVALIPSTTGMAITHKIAKYM